MKTINTVGIAIGIIWLIVGAIVSASLRQGTENIANTIHNRSAGDSLAIFMVLTGIPAILIIVSIAPYVIGIFHNFKK